MANRAVRRGSRAKRDEIRDCVIIGLILATIYSCYALAVRVLVGTNAFDKVGASIGAVVLSYYGSGFFGGTVVGLIRRWRNDWFGMFVASIITSLIVLFCTETAMSGPFWRWHGHEWNETIVLGIGFGAVGALLFRSK